VNQNTCQRENKIRQGQALRRCLLSPCPILSLSLSFSLSFSLSLFHRCRCPSGYCSLALTYVEHMANREISCAQCDSKKYMSLCGRCARLQLRDCYILPSVDRTCGVGARPREPVSLRESSGQKPPPPSAT